MTYWQTQKSYGKQNQGYTGYDMGGYSSHKKPEPKHDDMSKGHEDHKSKEKHGDSYLKDLIGKCVKINKGGPESFEGVLIGVESNYVVLTTMEGLVYINYSHIKSITEMSGDSSMGFVKPKYIMADSFNGVLRRLTKSFVQLNWGGPEKVEGFIAEVTTDSLLLVTMGHDLMRIPLYHIKTVKKAGKFVKKDGGKSGGSKTGGNKSGGKKTGGNKTGGNKTGGNKTGGSKTGGNKTGGKSDGHKTGGKSDGHKTDGGKSKGNRTLGSKTGGKSGNKQHSGSKSGKA